MHLNNFSGYGWISHTGDKCPIPNAGPGEWQVMFANGIISLGKNLPYDVRDLYWGSDPEAHGRIVAYRLIAKKQSADGWIPVIDERMPIELINAKSEEWEYRNRNGEIHMAFSSPWKYAFDNGNSPYDIIAVRLIEPAKKDGCTCGSSDLYICDACRKTRKTALEDRSQGLNIDEMLAIPARSAEAYLRFRASHRGREALAMIGKADGQQFKPLGEDAINDIAAEALREHDKVWPRKI